MNSYLQRIIMMWVELSPFVSTLLTLPCRGDLLTSSALQIKPIFQESPPPEKKEMKVAVSTSTHAGGNLGYIEKELGVDPEISSMFVELHCVSYLMEQNDNGTYALAKTDLHRSIYDAEKSVDELLRGGNYEARTVHGVQSNSGCCAISASIYVYRSLRRIPFSSTVYDYLVHLLKQDFEKVEVARTYRQVFPRELLFWIFFVAASSGQGRPEESFFKKELLVSRQALRISTWEVAKFVLKKFAWVEGWNESMDEALFNSLREL